MPAQYLGEHNVLWGSAENELETGRFRLSKKQTISSKIRFAPQNVMLSVIVDVTSTREWRDVVNAIETALVGQREKTRSEHLVGRLKIVGNTSLAWQLRRDADLLQAEAEQRAQGIGRTWVEKIELGVHPVDATAAVATADPLVELGQLMHSDVMASHGFREDIRQMIKDLLDDLPPESRKFAGNSEAEFETFVDELMTQSGDDIIARLKSPGREPQ